MNGPTSSSIEHCLANVTRLRLAVKGKYGQSAAEMVAQNTLYAEKLTRFPPQVVRDVCDGWAETGHGWPELPELMKAAYKAAEDAQAVAAANRKPVPQLGQGADLELVNEAVVMMPHDLESQARRSMDRETWLAFATAYGRRWRDRYSPLGLTLQERRAKLGRNETFVVRDLEDWARDEFNLPRPALGYPVAGSAFAKREGVV